MGSWERWVDWLEDAEDDLAAARELFRVGRYAKVCFLAQQAAEKALKALLMKRLGVYERTHSIAALIERVRRSVDVPGDLLDYGELLDRYYVPSRYPNAWPSGSPSRRLKESDARAALEAAVRILEYVKGNIQA
ncbi:HEPN domain-containing protein [Infirmifilum lucidum]|uniref:HEPN domain-containing protein n=1 Tax=Infirmifilum lucidum TaxID=2776706 RepID=A0A7L9FGK9_9CREN|nr:HEPN domain-containing protein [Infirmifilum lucidum]QOJ78761.1 HEPN domain-containing protein [Infirmifilum lucidum]